MPMSSIRTQLNFGKVETETVQRIHTLTEKIVVRLMEQGYDRTSGKVIVVGFLDKFLPILETWVHSKLSLVQSAQKVNVDMPKILLKQDVDDLVQEWTKELAQILNEAVEEIAEGQP